MATTIALPHMCTPTRCAADCTETAGRSHYDIVVVDAAGVVGAVVVVVVVVVADLSRATHVAVAARGQCVVARCGECELKAADIGSRWGRS